MWAKPGAWSYSQAGQTWADFFRRWVDLDQHQPNLAGVGKLLSEISQCIVVFDRMWPNLDQNMQFNVDAFFSKRRNATYPWASLSGIHNKKLRLTSGGDPAHLMWNAGPQACGAGALPPSSLRAPSTFWVYVALHRIGPLGLPFGMPLSGVWCAARRLRAGSPSFAARRRATPSVVSRHCHGMPPSQRPSPHGYRPRAHVCLRVCV